MERESDGWYCQFLPRLLKWECWVETNEDCEKVEHFKIMSKILNLKILLGSYEPNETSFKAI